jgi:hypothetical protein
MKKEKSTSRFTLPVKHLLSVLVLVLVSFYASAQCDGCNLFFYGDYNVARYTTHRYTVTNYDTDYPYGYWVIYGGEVVDEGIDADGEPYADVYWDSTVDGGTVTYGNAGPGFYEYGEYDVEFY